MKKASLVIVTVTFVFCAFAAGFFLGRSTGHAAISVSTVPTAAPTEAPTDPQSPADETDPYPMDLNTATAEDLTNLPGIGQTLAQRIIAYRDEKGGFESLSELLNVEGIGEKKLEAILDYITLGGQA